MQNLLLWVYPRARSYRLTSSVLSGEFHSPLPSTAGQEAPYLVAIDDEFETGRRGHILHVNFDFLLDVGTDVLHLDLGKALGIGAGFSQRGLVVREGAA